MPTDAAITNWRAARSTEQLQRTFSDPDFDDSDWPAAIVHSAADVGPKDGYDEVTWDDSAKLVWGESLKQDNTLLCRLTITE